MPTLLLGKKEINGMLKMQPVIQVVEQAFKDFALGRANMPPKAYLVVDKGDFRAMPAAVPGAVGVKWVNVHTGNPTLGLPTVMAVIIYNDPATGYPLAIMDATEITAFRTGAAAGVAAKYMARPDSHVLGIVGAGRQSYTQLLAHAALFDLKQVRIFDPSQTAIEKFIKAFPEYPIQTASLQETAASDIVCTVTPSRTPFLKKEWVKPGTHINAVGADARGKEELDPAILNDALVVVDDIRQASAAGEINVPVSQGLFRVSQIHATLGELVAGMKPGRKNDQEITVFDSTGVAIEDIAVARLIYEQARQSGIGTSLDLV